MLRYLYLAVPLGLLALAMGCPEHVDRMADDDDILADDDDDGAQGDDDDDDDDDDDTSTIQRTMTRTLGTTIPRPHRLHATTLRSLPGTRTHWAERPTARPS